MGNTELLLADQDARDAALDVERSFIVQAPAGSGKTELLIQRYLRLLATVDNPEEILAITFTRKAAAEMRFRVLEALRAAEKGTAPPEPHRQVTFAAATVVLEKDRALKWQLTSNPGRMRIQTLDALNASIARMQPISSGSGAALNSIVADAEMKSLYRTAAVLTLDQLVESGALHDATQQVLLHVDNNTALYVSYVARMLATRDQWLPFIGSGFAGADQEENLRNRFEANLKSAVSDYLVRVSQSFPAHCVEALLESARYAAAHVTAGEQGESPIGQLSEIRALPSHHAEDVRLWQGIAELLLTRQGHWRKTVTKNQGFPAGDDGQKQTMVDLLDELRSATMCGELLYGVCDLPPVNYSDEQWSVLLALFRLLPLAVTELKRLFSERGITDFVEVALGAANALGTAQEPGDIALLLDHQLRHLLVDEMQDTSSAQYRMLEALTGGWQDGDGRTLFCVGDPMQSIYRFRNAEVGQFLFAKTAGIGDVQLEFLTLRRNFRSGQHLVEWFNAVFPDVLAGADDASQSAVAYSAAVAVPNLAGQGECIVHPLFGSDSKAEADKGCDVIADTLAANPDDDMVVLVRSRGHLNQLLANLRRSGIPYRSVEIDRLTDLPEIVDVLALTRALVHGGDRLAWLAVLRSPWAGLDWCDLHALVKGQDNATVWELLNDQEQISGLSSYGRGAIDRLRELLAPAMRSNRIDSLRDRLERTWLSLGGPAILQDSNAVDNVYRYFDVIESIENGGTLSDVAELEDALDLEHVSSDTNARLQVMTMHRAKGLQFDHVVLFGLGRAPGRHERAVLSWFDIPGEHGIDEKVISPVGPRADIENDPLHRFIERVEASKFRHELGRLLYVACTRARQSLHLIGHVETRTPRSGSLLNLLWGSVAGDFDRAFDPHRSTGASGHGEVWIKPELHRFETEWQLPAFEGLINSHQPDDSDSGPPQVEFYWVGAEARLAGTLVHRWLQLAADNRITINADEMVQIRTITERWLGGLGVSGNPVTIISTRVELALQKMIDDEKGRWLLSGEGAAELPLTGVYDGKITSVVLDRVRIDDQGIHWIVDYKTSSHEGGDLHSFLNAEIDRYRPQLQRYQNLYRDYSGAEVRCAMYFPLLQQFVEVPL